ncbi:hypothetical protein FRC00_008197, partial [Tulasnella sp. 408]
MMPMPMSLVALVQRQLPQIPSLDVKHRPPDFAILRPERRSEAAQIHAREGFREPARLPPTAVTIVVVVAGSATSVISALEHRRVAVTGGGPVEHPHVGEVVPNPNGGDGEGRARVDLPAVVARVGQALALGPDAALEVEIIAVGVEIVAVGVDVVAVVAVVVAAVAAGAAVALAGADAERVLLELAAPAVAVILIAVPLVLITAVLLWVLVVLVLVLNVAVLLGVLVVPAPLLLLSAIALRLSPRDGTAVVVVSSGQSRELGACTTVGAGEEDVDAVVVGAATTSLPSGGGELWGPVFVPFFERFGQDASKRPARMERERSEGAMMLE